MRGMTTVLLIMSLGSLGAVPTSPPGSAVAAAVRDSTKRPSSRDGWPQTRAGELARLWVEAFSTSEAAMRTFNEKYLTPQSLAKRSVVKRTEGYRKLREQYGPLMLASVVKSTPGEVTVSLMDADGSAHEFIFAVQAEPPHKLVSVSIREQRHHGFGGFHH